MVLGPLGKRLSVGAIAWWRRPRCWLPLPGTYREGRILRAVSDSRLEGTIPVPLRREIQVAGDDASVAGPGQTVSGLMRCPCPRRVRFAAVSDVV